MRKIFNLFLFFIISSALAPVSAAAGLCAEKIDQNYVNLMMTNDIFGAGLDEVFDVEIRRVRPRTQGEIDRLKAFYYFEGKDEFGFSYPDNREYRWQLENNEYRLYKLVKDKDPERIEVYKAAFPAAKKFLYQLRLLKSNPRVYKELGLDKKLDALGLMGVVFRGGRGKLDFINSVNLAESRTDTPKVVIKNANTVLYRYALASAFEGTTRQVAYDEFHGPLGFKILMERAGEQEILDTYYGELLTAAGEKDDRYAVVNTIGGSSPTDINGIAENEIKYIYIPCRAGGNDTYGSPKAVFLPIKITDDKDSSFYPVFIFPAAFSNLETLNNSIRRELYHARWWNASAYLTDAMSREAFIRQAVPHIELDIFQKLKTDPPYAEFKEMYASLRLLLHDELSSISKHPERLQYDFPWTVNTVFIKPNAMYGSGTADMLDDIGSRYYNNVFAKLYPAIDGFIKYRNIAANSTASQDAWMTENPPSEKNRKKLQEVLVTSLVKGYSLTKKKRSLFFSWGYARILYLQDLDGMDMYKPEWKWAANQDRAFTLIDAVRNKGYSFGDLEWTFKLIKTKWPATDTFAKRFAYLVNTAKVTEITGLAASEDKPFSLKIDGEAADVKILLASMKGKGEKALQKAVNDASKQNEIRDLNDRVAKLNTQFKQIDEDYTQVGKDYDDFISDYDAKTKAAYESMTGQCAKSKNQPERDMEGRQIIGHYLAELESPECLDAAGDFIRVREDPKRKTLSEAVSFKYHEYVMVESNVLEAEALLDQAVKTSGSDGSDVASKLEQINASEKKVFKTWGDFSRAAFTEYFSGKGTSDGAAFQALEAKLKLIKDVKIEKGGVQ